MVTTTSTFLRSSSEASPAGRPQVTVRFRFTGRDEGDLSVALDPAELSHRREQVAPGRWTWLEQVHGADVVTVRIPGDRAGSRADGAVTDAAGAVLSVHTADCAPVLLRGDGGDGPVVGAAHAGWRGLRSGVLGATVHAMRALGATSISWRLGPCISPRVYEFGEEDLEPLVARFGTEVRARTSEGAPALDLRAAVRAALTEAGADEARPGAPIPCTVADPGWFSWRRDRTASRQAALIWIEADDADPAATSWWS